MRRLRHPPLWLRYVLAMSTAASVLIALVIAEHNSNGGAPAPENPAAEVQANRESRILVAQDQAPHTVRLPRRAVPHTTLEHAIASDMTGRIRHHELSGPLQNARCAASGAEHATRRAFLCTVLAGDARYPFLGIVDLRADTVTWCKRDPPPTPALNVAVSAKCRA